MADITKYIKSLFKLNSDFEIKDGVLLKYKGNKKKVKIPIDIKRIEKYAFRYCSSFKEINVDPKNEYYTSENGVLFNKNKTLLIKCPEGFKKKSYTIPDSVMKIGEYAFWWCSSIKKIIIPKSLTEIGKHAFGNCQSLKEITIPDSVTKIEKGVFESCVSLQKINTSSDNKYYSSEDGVLFNKDKTLLIKYPNGIEKKSYSIPDSVTEIDAWAFENCKYLKEIIISDNVAKIGENAFSYCELLDIIYAPEGLDLSDTGYNVCLEHSDTSYPKDCEIIRY